MRSTLSIYILVLLAFAIISSHSQEQPSEGRFNETQHFRHPLTDMPGPSEDVVTSHYFPAHPDQKLPIGENINMLCHFSNDGKVPLNITAIMASLNSPYDFNFYVQNFSYKPVGVVLKAGEEVTLEYQLTIHPMLEPVDFTLASTVFYESDELMYSTTYFNQTIELYLPLNDWDVATIMQLLFAVLSTVVVAVMVYYGCVDDKALPFTANAKKSSAYGDDSEKTDHPKYHNNKRSNKKRE